MLWLGRKSKQKVTDCPRVSEIYCAICTIIYAETLLYLPFLALLLCTVTELCQHI